MSEARKVRRFRERNMTRKQRLLADIQHDVQQRNTQVKVGVNSMGMMRRIQVAGKFFWGGITTALRILVGRL